MNISNGRMIGVSFCTSKLVDLLCEIDKIENDLIYVSVINGGYDAIFNSKTSMIKNKYNEVEARLINISETPDDIIKTRDYNIILNYLNRIEKENYNELI